MAKRIASESQLRRRGEIEEGMHTATVESLSVQPILKGECIVCGATLTAHFKDGRWTGCDHKRRRVDTLFVPPMTILLTPGTGAIVPETFTQSVAFMGTSETADLGGDINAAVDAVRETGRRVKRQFATIARRGSVRGRTAFLYFVAKAAPKDINDTDARVYKTVASHKRGMTFKDIVARAKLPASSVDWARQRLMKAGALIRKPQHATA